MTREYIKTDKNGIRYYKELRTCDRCGNIAGGLYIVGVNNGEDLTKGIGCNVPFPIDHCEAFNKMCKEENKGAHDDIRTLET